AHADCGAALQLPAAGGVRGDAPLRDAVPDRLPDGCTTAGMGSRRSRAAAAVAARPSAGPAAACARDSRAAGAAVVGGDDQALGHPSLRDALGRAPRRRARPHRPRMNIAILAPPWFAVPPTGYGGIEWVVSLLADGLVDAGHDVTLFASGDSRT